MIPHFTKWSDLCAVKSTILKAQLSGKRAQPRTGFHVLSGENQACDCGKRNSDNFWSWGENCFWFWSHSGWQVPPKSQKRQEKGDIPGQCLWTGDPETNHIRYCHRLGPAELPSLLGWARHPGSPSNSGNEGRDSTSGSVSSLPPCAECKRGAGLGLALELSLTAIPL